MLFRVTLLGMAREDTSARFDEIADMLAAGLTRLLESLLFGVSARDPITFIAVAAIMLFVAFAASFIPARRAMLVDPIMALRYE